MWDRIALYGGACVVAGGLLWAAFLREPALDLDASIDRALSLIAEKNYSEAQSLIADLRDQNAEDVRPVHLEAYYHESRGELAQAQDCYRDSLALCKDEDQRRHVMVFIADIDRRRGNLDRAEKYLDMTVKEHGRSRRTMLLRKLISEARNEKDKPVKDIRPIAEESDGGGVGR